jgi:hypothetical protein
VLGKAELPVKLLCILGEKIDTSGAQVGVVQNAFYHPFADTFSAMPRRNHHVAQVAHGGEVAHDASETDLPLLMKQSETKRVLNRFCNRGLRTIGGPIGRLQECCDNANVQARALIAQEEITIVPFHAFYLSQKRGDAEEFVTANPCRKRVRCRAAWTCSTALALMPRLMFLNIFLFQPEFFWRVEHEHFHADVGRDFFSRQF